MTKPMDPLISLIIGMECNMFADFKYRAPQIISPVRLQPNLRGITRHTKAMNGNIHYPQLITY